MNRLTDWDEYGNANPTAQALADAYEDIWLGLDFDTANDMTHLLNTLGTYEDTGLAPADIQTMRNELCQLCGKYKQAHLGACDGCRWRKQ